MRHRRRSASAAVLAVLVLGGCATTTSDERAAVEAAAPAMPSTAVAHGVVTVRGQEIVYRAEAGEMLMRNAAGDPRATIFSIAYLVDGADPATRPVSFLFNGGPGGATIALREGLSPRMPVNGATDRTFRYVDNPDSLIDATDLVFVDAPGTGYGRFFGDGASAEYWGVEEDAAATAAFINQWLAEHGRVGAPVFLVGESYAGVRVGLVAERLAQQTRPLKVKGVALVSPSTSAGRRASGPPDRAAMDESAVLALPSRAVAAQFHGKGAYTDLPVEALADQALAFARGPYAQALAEGEGIDPARKQAVAAELAAYLGLSPQTVLEADLWPSNNDFVLKLLADQGERIGGSDARAQAPSAITETREPPYNDPSTSPYTLNYDLTEAVEHLVREEIGYRPTNDYVRLSIEANRKWNWDVPGGTISIPMLFKRLMAADPGLRLTLMTGYYDLTIPYMRPVSDYLAAELPADRFENAVFRTGHAVFSDDAGRQASSDHLRAFYARAMR